MGSIQSLPATMRTASIAGSEREDDEEQGGVMQDEACLVDEFDEDDLFVVVDLAEFDLDDFAV